METEKDPKRAAQKAAELAQEKNREWASEFDRITEGDPQLARVARALTVFSDVVGREQTGPSVLGDIDKETEAKPQRRARKNKSKRDVPLISLALVALLLTAVLLPEWLHDRTIASEQRQELNSLHRLLQEQSQRFAIVQDESQRRLKQLQTLSSETHAAPRVLPAPKSKPIQVATNRLPGKKRTSIAQSPPQFCLAAINTGRLPIPRSLKSDIQVWSRVSRTLGGTSPTAALARLLSPDDTYMLTVRPVFHWNMLNAPKFFRVTLQNDQEHMIAQAIYNKNEDGSWAVEEFNSNLSSIEQYTAKSGDEWNPWRSNALPPLARGTSQSYWWWIDEIDAPNQNAAVVSTSGTGHFSVVNPATTARMNRYKVEFANSPLVLGVLYAHEGLLEDAKNELESETADKAKAAQLLSSLTSKP